MKTLHSSINFAMHKIKPGKITAGTIKHNFKGTIESFFLQVTMHSHL